MTDLARIDAVVQGRVQGVFFRGSTRKRAAELGLTGTVMNMPERGKVEVHAEGDREQLEKLLDFLKTGPRGARVDKVDAGWSVYTGSFSVFSIIY